MCQLGSQGVRVDRMVRRDSPLGNGRDESPSPTEYHTVQGSPVRDEQPSSVPKKIGKIPDSRRTANPTPTQNPTLNPLPSKTEAELALTKDAIKIILRQAIVAIVKFNSRYHENDENIALSSLHRRLHGTGLEQKWLNPTHRATTIAGTRQNIKTLFGSEFDNLEFPPFLKEKR